MISFDVARVVLSGSFRRDQVGLSAAYDELITTNCQVLSPHRMEFDDADFVRDEAESEMSITDIENHHLLAIKQADFVWLHAPDGYVGASAAFEIGYARAIGVPVFSRSTLNDVLLKEYVTSCTSVYDAKQLAQVSRSA